ncbi:hypothetical protein CRM22_003136 [Opisthorchis felineus]|uniref:Uncharacterized protein n=1 Tax=Opisthorchis felineus TaxID=147828 RepID=A0A4S2M399_OPIFE|nr:hypothetical protein CRM22_003136 [Opisthorchis felineus]
MQCLLEQERVKSQQKVINMEQESKLMKERMDMHLELEQKLKDQIEFYKTKYQNFNKTIAKSNKLFDSAKDEMEKSDPNRLRVFVRKRLPLLYFRSGVLSVWSIV